MNQARFQQNDHSDSSNTFAEHVDYSQTSTAFPIGQEHRRGEPKSSETQGPHVAQLQMSTHVGKRDVVKPHGHADPDAKVFRTAYDDAWSQLSKDEQANLSQETSIKTLFEKLDETDQGHQSETLLKRGKMSVGLGYVSTICGYINLVTAWIPVPGLDAGVCLLKGIIAVGPA